jgi:hypothetical protein
VFELRLHAQFRLVQPWLQGFKSDGGFSMDLRQGYFSQTDLRSGTRSVDRATIPLPTDQEIQQKTVNRNTALRLEYGFNGDWGVCLYLP